MVVLLSNLGYHQHRWILLEDTFGSLLSIGRCCDGLICLHK